MRKILILTMLIILAKPVIAEAAETDDLIQEITDGLDLSDIDSAAGETADKIKFSDLVSAFISEGADGVDGAMISEYIYDIFFYEIADIKPVFTELVCMSLLFALFGKALAVRQDYVSEIGFFAVYSGILLLLLESFSTIGDVVSDGISSIVSFMTAFIPTYAAALLVTGNATSAGVFYELAFGIIYILELSVKIIFLPGIHIFVLMLLLDNLFLETRFSKLAGLLSDGIKFALKIGIGAVVGLGVVQSLIAPAQDRITTNGLYRGLSALPGIGNTISAAGELVIGCGILVKNSLGAAALIILFFVCLTPLLKVLCYHLMYRIAAAVLEPFCDRRISDCVQAVGRGCALYLRIIFDVLLLFWITTGLIAASSSFIY
jgi:stage III sporulation protein AE